MRKEYSYSKSSFYAIDWVMVLLYIALVFFGWVNVYASVYNEEHSQIFDITQRYGKQMIWIVLAGLLAMAILFIDPKFFSSTALFFYGVMMVMLIAVLFFGKTINNSRSWFQIGSFAFQPAEFAKFATALLLAKIMSLPNFNVRKRKSLMLVGAVILLPVILIMAQPDVGSAIVFFSLLLVLHREGLWSMIMIALIYLFVLFLLALMFNNIIIITVIFFLTVVFSILWRKKIRNVLLVIAIGVVSLGFVLSVDYFYDNVLKDHQRKRIDVWTYSIRGVDIDKKDAGYNFYQSKVAIGSGGFSGKGFLEGTQTKMNFIPEQDTDFIFCTVGEEWGFLGSFFVVSLYGLLLIRIVKKAEKQRSDFSRIYGYAVASILLFHFLVNIGMTIGLVPVIGIPLPFISYGGSSLWSFTILLFIFIKQDSYRSEVI